MKLLLDENLPKRLKHELPGHEAFTVRDMGWNGLGNGVLLGKMKEHGFHALLTFDKNIRFQQYFEKYDLPDFVLDAQDNTYDTLRPLMTHVLEALSTSGTTGPIHITGAATDSA
jgi:hypothetical protein